MRKGRPKTIDKSGRTRGDKTLTVRVTPHQLNRLKDTADFEGLSVGELVRRRLFG